MPSPSVEQYLQSIYKLGGTGGRVQLKSVAEDLSVSPASVTEMAGRLDGLGLCRYEPYRGVTLTLKGRRMALNLLRKHRLWERFLADVLGLPWDVVHTEAHRLEHATSDEVAERLAAVLDNPETCPHGLPVPGPDGELTPRSGVLLSELEPGSRGVVIRVIRETAPLLSHLEKLGLTLGAVVEVRSRDPFDGAMLAAVRGVERAFGRTVTETVVVERLQGGDRGEDA